MAVPTFAGDEFEVRILAADLMSSLNLEFISRSVGTLEPWVPRSYAKSVFTEYPKSVCHFGLDLGFRVFGANHSLGLK